MDNANEITWRLVDHLKKQGWQATMVSIGRVKDLETEIGARHQKGLLDPTLFDEYLASFDFACEHRLADARSLIIVGMPQPQVRVVFETGHKSVPVIIPPTYSLLIDQQVVDKLDSFLSPGPYHFKKVRLPEKLLAARSRMAEYGKNNISYIPDSGSFYRPVVFVSDIPCKVDSWAEPAVMAQCEKCTACMNACPTNAISSDRFQLYAERCLTFQNERANDFPGWLSPTWHNSLMGCMICQKVCPANKNFAKWIETGAAFDAAETDLILNGAPREQLPAETFEKLKKLGMTEYYGVLGRNLRALIRRQAGKHQNMLRSSQQQETGRSDLTG
jgi:epoxyqueuosine reductase